MDLPSHDLIRVFEHDPELLERLDARVAAHLRSRVLAPRAWAEVGAWEPVFAPEDTVGHLGLLVLDGLLVRTVCLGDRECSEVVGPGDLLRPWDGDEVVASVGTQSQWRVLEATAFAVLDRRFATQASRFPTITAQLLARSTRRSRTLVHQAAIAGVRHAGTRVLLALWQLADRWGTVTAQGVRVPVPLTHQLLAQITCLQRPTVSAAIGALRDDGRISRTADGGWVLHGDPPRPAAESRQLTAA